MTDSHSEKTRVWLVEDNEVFRRNVQRVINNLDGMVCDGSFESAENTFAALQSNPAPEVILLDVQLPGIDGIGALEKFKEVVPDTRVIILTVFDDADKIFRAVCAGASGYVLKASGTDKIGDAIRQVMGGGAPMTPQVAKKVLDAFANSELMPGGKGDYGLTAREQEILRLLAEGLLKKEIADALSISVNTVSTHLRRVYDKLHVNTNTGAVAKALREGII
ncbi:MAG: LuxR family transcriptional regulator [Verrucomicrobiaceae bacterium]|nr:LuxR family transcriptional regulator [Verrucomicrobiaceae bacterium]